MDNYYVVEMVRGDEFTEGIYDTLDEAIEAAKHTWTHMNGYDRGNTKIEVRQYTEDIEDEDCDCFDYNTFTWWTCRDEMREMGGNLSWCKPYKVENIVLVVNEGNLVSLFIDDADCLVSSDVLAFIARQVDPDYNGKEFGESLDAILYESAVIDCRDCPVFDKCEAMDEAYMM